MNLEASLEVPVVAHLCQEAEAPVAVVAIVIQIIHQADLFRGLFLHRHARGEKSCYNMSCCFYFLPSAVPCAGSPFFALFRGAWGLIGKGAAQWILMEYDAQMPATLWLWRSFSSLDGSICILMIWWISFKVQISLNISSSSQAGEQKPKEIQEPKQELIWISFTLVLVGLTMMMFGQRSSYRSRSADSRSD
ncbi:hypothetical protein CK203_091117 [Vitis vinifera]|uniref:Uncharacterized protein n=1 Tax=Vitis vinifera TaxID=29760 RepID=A0A438D831_VITVI|nr:hypothetical protein CK203_091117 [Vitis vinifera]